MPNPTHHDPDYTFETALQLDPQSPAHRLDALALRRRLDELIAALPPVQQTILIEHYGLEGTPTIMRLVAERVGLTLSRANSEKIKALKQLRRNSLRRHFCDHEYLSRTIYWNFLELVQRS